MKKAVLVCDGGNPEYVRTRWERGCGNKISVPFNNRFNHPRCVRCGGAMITWMVEEVIDAQK